MAKKKEHKNKVKVKIEVPIRAFGSFVFKELGSAQKKVTKIETSPTYVFPKSTAAIAEI